MTLGRSVVLRGDARALPLADASVDLIVTSPPYWALRSYTDGGEHYAAQIGSEPTPQEYIASLIECTREWMRVLKPSGSLWVNLGDSYYSGKGAPGRTTVDSKSEARTARRAGGNPLDGPSFGVGRKSLVLLPERYRIACVDQLGLIARAVVIWSKPNGLPESVTDRVRRSHEDWVHLTKLPRYFSAVDEIREEHTMRPQRRPSGRPEDLTPRVGQPRQSWSTAQRDVPGVDGHSLGKLPGSVWEIPTQPLAVPDRIAHARCCNGTKRDGCEDGIDHFAAFPTEWPRRIILGWSPSGICLKCGAGRRPVAAIERIGEGRLWGNAGRGPVDTVTRRRHEERTSRAKTGEACMCPDASAPTRPSVVVDPFGGTGTTALVAKVLGRHGISVDRSADYCRLAMWRTTDRREIARAMRVTKPEPVGAAQLDLFGDESAA